MCGNQLLYSSLVSCSCCVAVGGHAPDLHLAGALGVEINILAVGRKFGAVVEAGGGGEALLFAASGGDGVNVELVVALAAEGEGFAIGGPAVPIGRAELGDLARSAAGDGEDVNEGFFSCDWSLMASWAPSGEMP